MILHIFLVLILVFIFHACRYLRDRILLLYNGHQQWGGTTEDFHDRWRELFREEDDDENHIHISGCEGLIIPLPLGSTCRQLLERVGCGGTGRHLHVPMGLEMFTSAGGKLKEGTDYCVWKSPPTTCNPHWGYLQYSEISGLWECRSRVTGIYNANTDTFDACRHGYLFDEKMRKKVKDFSRLRPADFWHNPERFSCRCKKGFVSVPELSRSTCFPDPCLSHLPAHVSVPGYQPKFKVCDCGDSGLYTNLYGNPQAPCTACPEHPVFDELEQKISVWIKCDGYYPCQAPEDLIRGCMKVTFSAKKWKEIYEGKDKRVWRERILGL